MITAANAFIPLVTLIPFHPEKQQEIIFHLIACEDREYLDKGKFSPECGFIMIGHVLDYFTDLADRSPFKQDMIDFAKRHTQTPRQKTARKAQAFLDRYHS